MTKLEQIARAIWAKFEENPDYARLQMNAILAEELARAAVEAMRSEHDVETLMRGAGAIATFNIETDGPAKPHEACSTPDEWMMRGANIAKRMVSGQEAARCFNAMIDSILNEREGS